MAVRPTIMWPVATSSTGSICLRHLSVSLPEQLYILRTLLESLVEKTSSKKTLRSYLESSQITAIENIVKTTFLWPHLLHYTGKERNKTKARITLCVPCVAIKPNANEIYMQRK